MQAHQNGWRTALLASALSTLVIADLAAQTVTLRPRVATPGQTVTAVLANTSEQTFFYPVTCEFRILRHSGEFERTGAPIPGLPSAVLPGQFCDAFAVMSPGQEFSLSVVAPNRPGSYTVAFPWGNGAVARLDVVAPSPGAQQIAVFPRGIQFPQRAFTVDFGSPDGNPWMFGNTGSTPHVFAPGAQLEIFVPGAPQRVAHADLAGQRIEPGGVLSVELPVQSLTPAPYTLVASFTDPVAGPVVLRTGFQTTGNRVALHLPDGHEAFPGQPLRLNLGVSDMPVGLPVPPFYFVLLGFGPGTTPLPSGVTSPLSFGDPLVLESLRSGLGGFIAGHFGQILNVSPVGFFFEGGADFTTFTNPGLPGTAGLTLRASAIVLNRAQTVFGASQSEDIILR